MALISVSSFAQRGNDAFKAYLYNDEYEVYLRINFYEQNIKIPGQELYGELPGYLGRKNHSFCWVMVSAEVENEKKAADIAREWNESKVDNMTIKDVLGGAQGVINIHTAAAE